MSSHTSVTPRLLRSAGIVGAIVLATYLGGHARDALGIEFSPESIRSWVASLGWSAPWIYLVLVAFRHFLALPSAVILPAGGALFGTGLGTLLGASGILATAMLNFALARGLARGAISAEWLERRVPKHDRLQAAGLPIVGLFTAHPLLPMTPLHWGAGFSTIGWLPFALVVSAAGLLRSFSLAFFGASLFDMGGTQFWLASGLLTGLVLLPFAHPALRRRFSGTSPSSETA